MKLFTKFQIGNVSIKQAVVMKNNRNDKVSFPILIPIPDFCQIYILPLPQFAQLNPPVSPLILPHSTLSYPSHLLISSQAKAMN